MRMTDIMKDLTRWGRDYLQAGNAMEIFRQNNVRFIAVTNGIDSEKPDTFVYRRQAARCLLQRVPQGKSQEPQLPFPAHHGRGFAHTDHRRGAEENR